jgi:translation initiation factor 1
VSEDKPFNSPFASLAPLHDSLPQQSRLNHRLRLRRLEAAAGRENVPRGRPHGALGSRRRKSRSSNGCLGVRSGEMAERAQGIPRMPGVVEGEALMLQGDHRKRLPEILTRRGVKRVIIGWRLRETQEVRIADGATPPRAQ